MRIMASFEELTDWINKAVPKADVDIFRPADMLRDGITNCLGRAGLARAALLAGQLVSEGVPAEKLVLIFNQSHGLEFKPGRFWMGHAALVVDAEPGVILDSYGRSCVSRLNTTSWKPGVPPTEQGVITHHADLAAQQRQKWGDLSPERRAYLGREAIYQGLPFSRAYEFSEGLERYQLDHPTLRSGPLVTPDDYAEAYAVLFERLANNISAAA